MAQFDVHRNPGRHTDTIPYVVVVQSAQFDDYRRRVVVPLVRASNIGAAPFPSFNPSFRIHGAKVVLHPLEMVSVPVEQLGSPIDTLADKGQTIIAALDELFSRAWK
jgi:toxin CcdB